MHSVNMSIIIINDQWMYTTCLILTFTRLSAISSRRSNQQKHASFTGRPHSTTSSSSLLCAHLNLIKHFPLNYSILVLNLIK